MENSIITNLQVLEYGGKLVKEILSEPYMFDGEWLRARGWCMCPVADMLDEEIIGRVVELLTREAIPRLLAFSTWDREPVFGIALEPSLEALEAFQDETVLRSYLVVPEGELCFALLSEGSYFSLVAGPPSLVRSLLGGDSRRWIEEFREYALVELRTKECQQYLRSVLDRCLDSGC